MKHALYDGQRIRLEAWRNAQDQGTHVARNILGAKGPYAMIPWFWSVQYDQTFHVTGLSDFGESTIHRDLGGAGQMNFQLTNDGRLVAASAIGLTPGLARDVRLAEMLIQQEA